MRCRRWLNALWWLPGLLIAVASLLAVTACGPSATRLGSCTHDGSIRRVQIQSVNAAIITCRDGRVFRYDTNNG